MFAYMFLIFSFKCLASLSSTSLLWTVELYSVMVGVNPRVHHFTKETPHLSDFWEITLCFTVWSLAFQLACPPGCTGSTSLCLDSSAFSLLFSMCLLIPYPQCGFFFLSYIDAWQFISSIGQEVNESCFLLSFGSRWKQDGKFTVVSETGHFWRVKVSWQDLRHTLWTDS